MGLTRGARNHSNPRCASSPSLRGCLCREQRETRARTPMNTRSLWGKDGRRVVVPPLFHAPRRTPNRKSGPLIPSLSFPRDCNDLLPAQVARSARRRSTSRLHERARHVWRRGTVHSSLLTPTPRPKVRKSGAVAKAVLASMVLEEGPIGVARGDSRDIRRIKERALLRGMPALLCTLRFCHAPSNCHHSLSPLLFFWRARA